MAEKVKAEVDLIEMESDDEEDTSQLYKESITVVTYVELHPYVKSVVEILEDVYICGRNKGRQDEYKKIIAFIVHARAGGKE